MSDRPRLPALARWSAAAVVVPLTVVLTFASVFEFGSHCPSGGGAAADPATPQRELCAQATGATNPGDVLITVVSLLVGSFLVALLLRSRRWLGLLLVGALCVATPVAALVVMLAAPTECAAAQQRVGGDCASSGQE
ncbi:hypothetical protein EKO23_06760 [Nocardioides guangzhouensis]|uniref:Uncharacterized protein n=1 Tax=Nocardioides guangzhouensis TaxID=2497878 RepID=A0A4Q4ZIU6_9ACTN|nr:hypothetical protein [Nocardioides guangzhouensis]RYP87294.1 hypothetical protein EKO23_06760 [Nocardioides guangzhouensis]